jgi:hypothetical protein
MGLRAVHRLTRKTPFFNLKVIWIRLSRGPGRLTQDWVLFDLFEFALMFLLCARGHYLSATGRVKMMRGPGPWVGGSVPRGYRVGWRVEVVERALRKNGDGLVEVRAIPPISR